MKQSENLTVELQRRTDELTGSLQNSGGENQRLQLEIGRLKNALAELQEKYDGSARENKHLSGEINTHQYYITEVYYNRQCSETTAHR